MDIAPLVDTQRLRNSDREVEFRLVPTWDGLYTPIASCLPPGDGPHAVVLLAYGNGGGGILRWIIGLVIALVGVFSYYHTTTKNPVTGEMQHVALTPQQEMSLGLQSAPRMAGSAAASTRPS